MIRLPPTFISLGQEDILDYEMRQQGGRLKGKTVQLIPADKSQEHFQHRDLGAYSGHTSDEQSSVSKNQSLDVESISNCSEDEVLQSSNICPDTKSPKEEPPVDGALSYINNHFVGVLENGTIEVRRSSPSKYDFHYGGFIESPAPRIADDNSQRSSPFAPEDSSTPQNSAAHPVPETRGRVLPRSPLFYSHNASISPEHRQTLSLTPHVQASVAAHNSPGILFSYPARRSRNFRHQTNSFSFDESERSSAAYDHHRESSISTTNSKPRPSSDINLHEELRGRRVQESASDVSSSPPVSITPSQNSIILVHRSRDITPLQLPPPFSTTSRNSSGTESLPSYNSNDRLLEVHPSTSPIRPESSPEETTRIGSTLQTSPHSRLIQHASRVARVFSLHRTRSQVADQTGSPLQFSSRSTTPRRTQPDPFATTDALRTPFRNYLVYNDELPSYIQPQTPDHLPESRHRSRYHPSYTAPLPRGTERLGSHSNTYVDGPSDYSASARTRRAFRVTTTPSRRAGSRYEARSGTIGDGYQGLFAGIENGDPEVEWVRGVRFNNAGVRLWDNRNARDVNADGDMMGRTPETEQWRIGPGRR